MADGGNREHAAGRNPGALAIALVLLGLGAPDASARDGAPGAWARALAIALALFSIGTAAASARAAAMSASADSARATTLAASVPPVRLAAGELAPPYPSGFTLRRVPNPRYRPPSAALPALGIGSAGAMRAIDHLRFHVARRGSSDATRLTEWQITAGEQRRSHDAIQLDAAGESRLGHDALRALALEARMGGVVAGLGDVPAIPLGRMGSLQRLRGFSVASTARTGASWRGVSGVPTPVPGLEIPRVGLAGGMIENLKLEGATTSLALFGFGRGRVKSDRAPAPGDTLAGTGGAATIDVQAPLPLGSLAFFVGAQVHDLDGARGLAAQQGWGWTLGTPGFALSIHDERATDRTRLLRTDGLSPAARREDRWNAQAWLFRRRAETHFSGVLREGGDPAVSARTMQLGASGNWGRSSWYSGADLYLSRRMLEAVDERRLSLHSGRISGAGHGLLLRFDRTTDGAGRDATQAAGELALALGRGARLSLEPRLSWDSKQAQQADAELRVSWPLQTFASRLTGSLSFGGERENDFRPALREATLALAFAPRSRDRADLEVRRRDDWGVRSYETTASYDLAAQRYDHMRGPLSSRDQGLVIARVVRADGSGVPDVLVTLDGRESRFTDATGEARFERVAPGVHLMTVEERSLPEAHQVITTNRVYVTVERGRDTDPLRFEIHRPERRTKF